MRNSILTFLALMMVVGMAQAAPIFEEQFTGGEFDSSSVTIDDWGPFEKDYDSDCIATDLYTTEPSCFVLYPSKGSGGGWFTKRWDLGGSYDFYQGGDGEMTFDYKRASGASATQIVLYSDTTPVATFNTSLNDNDWHSGTMTLDGDETNVTHIHLRAYRSSGTSSIRVGFDNFVVTPEPATMGLLGFGALGLLARRRRK